MPKAEAVVSVGELSDIYMVSGLAQDPDGSYRGFVTITCQSVNGDIFKATMDPEDVRKMALQWLESAESADQDCIVMTMLTRDLEIPPGAAAGFITAMRNERHGEGIVMEVPGEEVDDEDVPVEPSQNGSDGVGGLRRDEGPEEEESKEA